MAYSPSYTKYGSKRTSDIALITGMEVGDTVFNLDYLQVEWYSGSTWLSNNCIQIVTSQNVTQGMVLYINSSGTASIISNTLALSPLAIGLVHYGGSAGSTISVKICGVAKAISTGGANVNEYARAGGINGTVGTTTATPSGTLGRNLQNSASNSLFYVYLSFIERA